ncbi:MAG: hypothetical protein NUV80_07525, partial [Candidatus Berkelbacteria bacterium]|nr:hypothetical protein [Candidatus Berkelbacteria bacterium]
MTAQTGRTHSKWLTVKVDNAAGALTDISAYTSSISAFGLTYDVQDVTAFSDLVKNVVIGQPVAAFTLGGPIDTVIITHMAAINGVGTPLSVDLQMGIRHAWEATEPQYGITSSASSGFVCNAFTVDPVANTWSASFDVFGPTAPLFG